MNDMNVLTIKDLAIILVHGGLAVTQSLICLLAAIRINVSNGDDIQVLACRLHIAATHPPCPD